MSFLTVLVVLFSFIIAGLIGILIAFVLMRPARRKLFRKNPPVRISTLVIISLIIFTLIFGVSTHYWATAYYRVVSNRFEDVLPNIQAGSVIIQQGDSWNNNKPAIIKEIWWQQMMVPRNDSRCYAGDQVICNLIKDVGLSGASNWKSYVVYLGLGLAGVLSFMFYSIWILKLNFEVDSKPEEKIRSRPKSKARHI
ncbi:MAG: hypothetical protein A2X25_08495 [Chloroflexi bacterium GWB2_49_20]|nr:MAG: hypothetical protein A2X25_08495 [Chloroflexi bacterium GWB2_49_20]OGN79526.1 MAG: hypothetical protein A2X26_05530 [Chloroflexi bacterium GWC2_49_37]OGN84551.1 MAG: hypothetical protein A2X27_11000 [Chloroflexi bacterium GWD2_49_16]HBG74025.1 hypothetical protein [Anaerolineae bacterium]HCC78827.1 hypothetical protein [Anaerolineae bacterium]